MNAWTELRKKYHWLQHSVAMGDLCTESIKSLLRLAEAAENGDRDAGNRFRAEIDKLEDWWCMYWDQAQYLDIDVSQIHGYDASLLEKTERELAAEK